MPEPALSDVFGASASQDSTTLTIAKSDLAATGLVASGSNTAEALLASIILLARNALAQATFESNLDQSITIVPGFDQLVQRDDGTGTFANYRLNQLTVNMHSQDSTEIDPNNY